MLEIKIKLKQKDDNTKLEVVTPKQKDLDKATPEEKTTLAVVYNAILGTLNDLGK